MTLSEAFFHDYFDVWASLMYLHEFGNEKSKVQFLFVKIFAMLKHKSNNII